MAKGKVQVISSPLARIAAGIIKELEELYEPGEAQKWMLSPHPQLGGKSAVMLIKEGRADEVRRVIAALKDGAYL